MRDYEELELDPLAGLTMEDGEDLENYEDFEEFEDQEDFEDFEEFEDFEDLEDGELGLDPELWESAEADPFIGKALRRVRRALPGVLSNPLLKRVARMGAGALGQAIGGKQGAALANMVANQVLREASLEGDFESDFEDESDFESDFEASGGDLEVLYEMQYYADRAARAESQDEADQFIPVIAGLATKLLPKAMPLIGRGIGHWCARAHVWPSQADATLDPHVAARRCAKCRAPGPPAGHPRTSDQHNVAPIGTDHG
jgi:hypothetical protein